MKTTAEIRLDNLEALIQEAGTATALAQMCGLSHIYLSQVRRRTADAKTGNPRNIGEKMARALESGTGKPKGWMDTPHDESHRSASSQPPTTDITIHQYDAAGSMGHGLDLPDQPGVIQNLRVNKEWLSKNIRAYSAAKNLCVVTGFGDSMQPMFNPGDPLLVDLGVTSVEFDAVYFFRVDNLGYVKRLQRIPTEDGLVIRAISENKDAYGPFDITEKMDFHVIGRVLKVWRSQEF
ncbi:helix-turn-helix transcriptional regulator [Castellaniella hirudinis]|uniref:S24 family peptidase n=1 Tax=Castellaniella hirudinis TaxID=1144617 RepID=UPI0039C2C7FE